MFHLLVLTTLALMALAAHIQCLGFSVERQGEAVVVVSVMDDLPAAKEGLEAGAEITAITQPKRSFVTSPLWKMSDEDLVEALTPSHFDNLKIFVSQKGRGRVLNLVRTDPRPDPYFAVPLPPERVARLSSMEKQVYEMELMRKKVLDAAKKPK